MPPVEDTETLRAIAGFPSICRAKRLYDALVGASEGSLNAWEKWLTEESDADNAAYVTLWKLIEDTIDRRERGDWQSNRTLPGARTMENWLQLTVGNAKVERVALFTTGPGPSNSNDTPVFRNWFRDQLVRNGFDSNHYTPIDLDSESSPILESPELGTLPPLKITAYKDPRSERLLYLESVKAPEDENRWIHTLYEDLRDLVPAVLHGRRRRLLRWRWRYSPGLEPLRRAQGIRESIEHRARLLVGKLESESFRNEFARLSFQSQLELAENLLPGLGCTAAGRAFLGRLLADDDAYDASGVNVPDGPPPLSLDWLLGRRQADPSVYGTAKPSAVLVINEWLPILLQHAERRPDLITDRITRFLALTTDVDDASVQLMKQRAADLAPQLRHGVSPAEWAELVPPLVNSFKEVHEAVGAQDRARLFAEGSLLISAAKLADKLFEFWQDPNRGNALSLGTSVLKFNKDIFEYVLTDEQQKIDPRFKALKRVTQVLSLYDAYKDVVESIGASRRGEHGAAIGQGLQAIGTAAPLAAAAAYAATGKKIAALGAMAGPKGKAVAGLVVLGGVIVVMATAQAPLQRWFRRNAFGRDWSSVKTDAGPQFTEFRFRRRTINNDVDSGPPNLVRQVSEFHSLVAGVTLTTAKLESGKLRVILHFPLYYADSLAVFRGWNPSQSDRTSPVWFNAVPLHSIYHPPISRQWPVQWHRWQNSRLYEWFQFVRLRPAGPPQYGPPSDPEPFDPQEWESRMYAWEVALTPGPEQDSFFKIPTGTEWLEVDLVSPKLADDADRLAQVLEAPVSSAPDYFSGDEALVLRARRQISW